MNKMLLVVLFLFVVLFGCGRGLSVSEDERGLLPPEPSSPGETKQLPSAVGKAIPVWAVGGWAVEDRARGNKIAFSNLQNGFFVKDGALTGTVGGHHLVWSKVYYTDVNYILGALRSANVIDGEGDFVGNVDTAEGSLNTASVWVPVDLDNNPVGHWIDLRGAASNVLTFSIPGANFELNNRNYNVIVSFGCDVVSQGSTSASFKCNDASDPNKLVEIEAEVVNGQVQRDASGKVRVRMKSGSSVGSWLLRDFDVALPLPPAPALVPQRSSVSSFAGDVANRVSLTPLTGSLFDKVVANGLTVNVQGFADGLVWSEFKYVKTVDATPAWQTGVLGKVSGGTLVTPATPGWIPVAASDTLSAVIPAVDLDVNALNGVAVFMCQKVGRKNGFFKYDCGGKNVKVNGDRSAHASSEVGAWVLETFDVATTDILPPAICPPGQACPTPTPSPSPTPTPTPTPSPTSTPTPTPIPCGAGGSCPAGQSCVNGQCVVSSATPTVTPTPTPTQTVSPTPSPTPTPSPAPEQIVVKIYDGLTFADPVLGQAVCSLSGTATSGSTTVCKIRTNVDGFALILEPNRGYIVQSEAKNVNTGALSALLEVKTLELQQLDGTFVRSISTCAGTTGECRGYARSENTLNNQMYQIATSVVRK